MDLEALIEQLDLMAHFQVEALVPAVEGISDAIGQQNALLQQQNAMMTRILALLEVLSADLPQRGQGDPN